ncbi:MAG: hypothetical protein AVDCRST_MAG78-503 [uncultured Rubrobacteraceae bacterium]|uniref:Uncharacterized protein n=1 Tax=uncultured Rubrobacteraceae bacterium TaxID=349277 RepID=A0A6J4PFH8_9ACTN|nr:MAG: hypothetical protein AVDCRST_MAG78-503 [uncultured Rubrobacteraceae bacterium]
MDSKSLAQVKLGRSRFVDPDFCRELSELTGMDLGVLTSVFAGERKHTALDTVKTVVAENLDKTPEAWTEILLERAKAEGMGEYRPGYWDGYELTWEHNEHLRRIGRLD